MQKWSLQMNFFGGGLLLKTNFDKIIVFNIA